MIAELSRVSFRYEPALPLVLQDVSLSIGEREFAGVIGPNGGGKSTLLRLIVGQLAPVSGTVRIFDEDPCRMSGPTRSRIGYVAQRSAIDMRVPATAMDVVLTGLIHRNRWGCRYTKAERELASEAMRQTEVLDLRDRAMGTLSGGQSQRVLIARALVGNAKLLLLDEPTAGLDPNVSHRIADLLRGLSERLSVVIVSHDVLFVTTHVKRILCLNRRLTCDMPHEMASQDDCELVNRIHRQLIQESIHPCDCCAHVEAGQVVR